jgi:hypothetical protein
VVPAEPGQGVEAPKSHGGDARNDRGPNPKIGHGVQGGESDAVMLRSAEADPHITEHTLRAGAEAPVAAEWKSPCVTDAEAPVPLAGNRATSRN